MGEPLDFFWPDIFCLMFLGFKGLRVYRGLGFRAQGFELLALYSEIWSIVQSSILLSPIIEEERYSLHTAADYLNA